MLTAHPSEPDDIQKLLRWIQMWEWYLRPGLMPPEIKVAPDMCHSAAMIREGAERVRALLSVADRQECKTFWLFIQLSHPSDTVHYDPEQALKMLPEIRALLESLRVARPAKAGAAPSPPDVLEAVLADMREAYTERNNLDLRMIVHEAPVAEKLVQTMRTEGSDSASTVNRFPESTLCYNTHEGTVTDYFAGLIAVDGDNHPRGSGRYLTLIAHDRDRLHRFLALARRGGACLHTRERAKILGVVSLNGGAEILWLAMLLKFGSSQGEGARVFANLYGQSLFAAEALVDAERANEPAKNASGKPTAREAARAAYRESWRTTCDQNERERLGAIAASHLDWPHNWTDVHSVEDLADYCEHRLHVLEIHASSWPPGAPPPPRFQDKQEFLMERLNGLAGRAASLDIVVDLPDGPVSLLQERRLLLKYLAAAKKKLGQDFPAPLEIPGGTGAGGVSVIRDAVADSPIRAGPSAAPSPAKDDRADAVISDLRTADEDSPNWNLIKKQDGQARMSAPELASKFDLGEAALEGRLRRWRKGTDTGWFEPPNPGPREPKILYTLAAVLPVIEALWSKTHPVTGGRNPKKELTSLN